MNKNIGAFLTGSVFCLCFVSALFFFIISKPYQLRSTTVVFVTPGANLHQVARQLKKAEVIKITQPLILYLRLFGHASNIKAGEYVFSNRISLKKIAHILISGKVKQHAFTIVEGWHIEQLLAALNETKTMTLPEDRLLTKEGIAEVLHLESKHAEGWFLPDTYFYTRASNKFDLLLRSHHSMRKVLDKLWKKRLRDLPYRTPYEALIVASMIEKESALESERPLISSVIVNRLHKKMRLQIDPTVIYGLKHQSKLTKAALRSKTRYNTYAHHGLPPTPISMPSLTALQAAFFPAFTEFYYFVAKGDGSHVFSKTLAEQSQAIRHYRLQSS